MPRPIPLRMGKVPLMLAGGSLADTAKAEVVVVVPSGRFSVVVVDTLVDVAPVPAAVPPPLVDP